MDRSGYGEAYTVSPVIYDAVLPHPDVNDVPFFVDMALRSKGPVLEIGCGTGRVLIATARAGVEIVGLDLSQSMLSVCERKLASEPQAVRSKVQLMQGDMRDFDLGRKFALVTAPFYPFHHLLTVEDQLSCLHSIHLHLIDKGILILALINPSIHRLAAEQLLVESGCSSKFVMDGGQLVTLTQRTVIRDLCNQIEDFELIYDVTYPDGSQEQLVDRFQMRFMFRFEGEHLLARCRFQLEELLGDYDRTPYGPRESRELIFVARKAEVEPFKASL